MANAVGVGAGAGAAGRERVVGERVIDLRNVSKTYRGKVQALRGISMHVERGEIFGLLGPNGAGKSTLVKILMTVISPTACEGTMLGRAVGDKGTLSRVGYLPEHHRFPEYLTGRQVVEYFAALSGVDRTTRKRRSQELLEQVGLKDWQNHRVKQYSKGMRQRVGIAQALVMDPDIVLLDEPTDGVDPVGRRDIRNILIEEKRRGRTVFLNSHLLSELEMVCDRVAIMVQGTVRMQGTIAELTKDSRRYEIEVALPGTAGPEAARLIAGAFTQMALLPAPVVAGAAPPTLIGAGAGNGVPPVPSTSLARFTGTLPGGTPVVLENSLLTVSTDDPETVQPILDALRAKGLVIRSVKPIRSSLEDLFMQAVTDPTTGQTLAPGAARDGKKGGGR